MLLYRIILVDSSIQYFEYLDDIMHIVVLQWRRQTQFLQYKN